VIEKKFSKPPPLSPREYEKLGRIVASVYETGYLDMKQTYKNSLIKGALAGFGGVLGATVLIAVLLWALSLFHEVPLIGNFVTKVEHSIQSGQDK